MASRTRDQMIEGAMDLLATRGLHGTSLAEVIEATGAPRGSIYHHFPGGKDELIAAAVDLASQRYTEWMDRFVGASPEMIIGGYLQAWRHTLLRSGMKAGCPILAVTVSTNDQDIIDHARNAFRSSRSQLTTMLADAGIHPDAATAFATIAVAAAEGAVVLARAEHDIEPFETVTANLTAQAAALPKA